MGLLSDFFAVIESEWAKKRNLPGSGLAEMNMRRRLEKDVPRGEMSPSVESKLRDDLDIIKWKDVLDKK